MPPQTRAVRLTFGVEAPACPVNRPFRRAFPASSWVSTGSDRFRNPAEAPALPFVPFAIKGTREMQAMLAERRARRNRLRHRPPLALALVGLLASLLATMTTSPAGESALTAAVPVIRRCAHDMETALVESFAREHGLRELTFNDAAGR